jgi:hypothetical protein
LNGSFCSLTKVHSCFTAGKQSNINNSFTSSGHWKTTIVLFIVYAEPSSPHTKGRVFISSLDCRDRRCLGQRTCQLCSDLAGFADERCSPEFQTIFWLDRPEYMYIQELIVALPGSAAITGWK